MTWSFRLRFQMSRHQQFTAHDDASEVTITTSDGSVILRSTRMGTASEPVESILDLPRVPINEASELALHGSGYDTEDAAKMAASRWRARLVTALASLWIGVDFGARAAGGMYLTRHGEAWLRQQAGLPPDDERRVFPDSLGVLVFETDTKPLFFNSTARPVGTSRIDHLVAALNALVDRGYLPSAQEQLAYDAFGASFFADSVDVQFLLRMVAVETLIDQRPRSDRAQEHVAKLVTETKRAGLDDEEARSMIGVLGWLKRESITQAGRRLARTLDPRTYANESAETFFANCYEMRGALVHPRTVRPPLREVGIRSNQLRLFVAHLLSGPLLGAPPGSM